MKFNSSKIDDYHTPEFSKVFGDEKLNDHFHCHEISNADLVFNNLFYINNEIIAIDYEWCFNFPIPIEYIFWRSLYVELAQNSIFKKYFTIEEIFENLKLNNDWLSTFRNWEREFMKYVGGHIFPKQDIITGKQILNDLDHYKKLANDKDKEINNLNKQLDKLKKSNSELNSKLKLMEESTSWKVTSPLRDVMRKLK